MQGASHCLVVPLVFPTYLAGVTNYRAGKHVIEPLPPGEPPFGVVSGLVQPDFEFKDVMYSMIRLEQDAVVGELLRREVPLTSDEALKRHFVHLFTETHSLPCLSSVLETAPKSYDASNAFLRVGPKDVLSLELLRNIVHEQIRVEMAGLSFLAKTNAIRLVYTWDPPSIFAQTIGIEVLDDMWFEAVTAEGILSEGVVCIAYNDFRNKQMIGRLRAKLPSSVDVIPKYRVHLRPGEFRVLHMNGDAFGTHVRTQPCHTSLEGAIGCSTSAAASLCLREPHPIHWV